MFIADAFLDHIKYSRYICAYGTRARSARGSQNCAILSIICPFTGNSAFLCVNDVVNLPCRRPPFKDVSRPLQLRIFSRMSRTCHASQTTKVNTMLKVQTFSTRMERESMWHYGIAVDPGLLGNVTQWRDSENKQSL